MKSETQENKFLKHCLNCEHEVESSNPEHIYCTQCGYPVRNECTGTATYNRGYGNEPVEHEDDQGAFLLEPHMVYCPKCAFISLFAQKGLIENNHPKVEIINAPISEGSDPFF